MSWAPPPSRHNWRRWRLTQWLVHRGYAIGIIAGSGTTWKGSDGPYVSLIMFAKPGRPPNYVLGWPTHKWRCLLRYRHWPSPHSIAWGFCVKCVPCADCGLPVPADHDCEAE